MGMMETVAAIRTCIQNVVMLMPSPVLWRMMLRMIGVKRRMEAKAIPEPESWANRTPRVCVGPAGSAAASSAMQGPAAPAVGGPRGRTRLVCLMPRPTSGRASPRGAGCCCLCCAMGSCSACSLRPLVLRLVTEDDDTSAGAFGRCVWHLNGRCQLVAGPATNLCISYLPGCLCPCACFRRTAPPP